MTRQWWSRGFRGAVYEEVFEIYEAELRGEGIKEPECAFTFDPSTGLNKVRMSGVHPTTGHRLLIEQEIPRAVLTDRAAWFDAIEAVKHRLLADCGLLEWS